MPRCRSRPLLAVATTLVAALLSSEAPASDRLADAVTCRLPGVHYVGTTSQKMSFCLTLSRNRRTLREFALAVTFRCPASGVRFTRELRFAAPSPGSTLSPTGTIVVRPAPESVFTARVLASSAQGTFRLVLRDNTQPQFRCVTGEVRWNARRKA